MDRDQFDQWIRIQADQKSSQKGWRLMETERPFWKMCRFMFVKIFAIKTYVRTRNWIQIRQSLDPNLE